MRKTIFVLMITLVIAATFALPTAALAYDGVQGTVTDSTTSSPWTHGGTVTVYALVNGGIYNCGSSSINTTTGIYSITWDCTTDGALDNDVDDGTDFMVAFTFNAGPGGEPKNQTFRVTEVDATPGNYVQDAQTGTTPTAVSLMGFSANSSQSSTLVLAIAALALLSGLVTYRRRAAAKI